MIGQREKSTLACGILTVRQLIVPTVAKKERNGTQEMTSGAKPKGLVDDKGRECTACGTYKLWSKFHRNKNGYYGYGPRCIACRSAELRTYTKKNKKHVRRSRYNSRIKREYGIDIDDHDKLREHNDSKCWICSGGTSKNFLAVDHNHKNGNVRGLLCARCNTALARMMDKVENMERAVEYMHDDGDTVKKILGRK